MPNKKLWTNLPPSIDQEKKFGYKLSHFRKEKNKRHDVIGGKNHKHIYSVCGFGFKNLEQSSATIEETLVATINDFVEQNLVEIDVDGKNVTLVLHHEGLREAD